MAKAIKSSDAPEIFISYSHKDSKWLEYVHSYLSVAVKHGVFKKWDDREISGGADWRADINVKLDACDVCVLLVSRYSLSSDFILDVEVKRMLQRRKREGAHIYPIVVTPTPLVGVDWLKKMNLRPRDGTPLSTLSARKRDTAMVAIVDEIAEIIERIAAKKPGRRTRSKRKPTKPGGQSDSEPEPVPTIVDLARLPATPYRTLVGREGELQLLDRAWDDESANIVSLIAWGGAGKTALVNEWLKRLQAENYRGAAVVLGWSFYSQGTKERATSAEGFLDWALGKLGVPVDTLSATLKGERLAEALARRRVLLVLDGVEPLQHGPGVQEGQLKDQGLRIFLRRFAAMPPASAHGLVVVTSRLAVHDIEQYRTTERVGAVQGIDLVRLSDQAGAALLKDNGIKGSEKERQTASCEYEGHALALSLLATFLVRRHHGDIRRRDHLGALLRKADVPGHDHARRVMQAYETEWLADKPAYWAIMCLVGLFDRPASADCIDALRREPAIEGFTNPLVRLSSDQWADAISALREVRLLDPEDVLVPGALDAHPLVREWFGERLREKNTKAWREAHGRLYEYLRDTTEEGKAPTLDELAPLYQAIGHGCRAQRHQEALEEIYQKRICRLQSEDELEYYSWRKLGAFGTDLAAISWFFTEPYSSLVETLPDRHRPWILGQVASGLRAQGRFAESVPPRKAELDVYDKERLWLHAAISASNLSQAELAVGEIATAVADAARSVVYADRSNDQFQMITKRVTHATALYAAGLCEQAETLFADAERRQLERKQGTPFLQSLAGHERRDWLLDKGDWALVRQQAESIAKLGLKNRSIMESAFVWLSLGRAYHGSACLSIGSIELVANTQDETRIAGDWLDQAIGGFRAAGTNDYIVVSLAKRGAFRRSIGDWPGAARDLDEVEEIAEPGPMRLLLCDVALERARLAFARIEAFAPLNGMLERDNPSRPEVPGAEEIARLKQEAEQQLKIAADYIQTCGYHRRDEELAELQAVLRGERKFAELPPRV